MTRLALTLGAAASAITLSMAQPAVAEEAPSHSREVTYTQCRPSSGTTGLAVGGVAGALIGGGIFGGLLAPIIGAVGGAFAGRAIDRNSTKPKRCRTVRDYDAEDATDINRRNQEWEAGRRTNEYAQPSGGGYTPPAQYDNGQPIREEDRDLVHPEHS
ncbi:MAG: hypothetical protein JWQ16_1051 [Novosphingobium sp.]|nr:hypothetical protein [Novosphingobium sp.]